jgi:rfaE bifunctional protein kinase chain/domain
LHSETLKAIDYIRNKYTDSSKIVFVSGDFNIVHPGHLRMLRFASECGEHLVVGITPNNSDTRLLTEDLRLEGVKAIGLIDETFILRDSIKEVIEYLQPGTVVKGKDFENTFNVEQNAVNSYGGNLLFSSGGIRFSSLDLLKNEFEISNRTHIKKPLDFLKRHNINRQTFNDYLKKISQLNILVIGDLIIDEYVACDALGMSREDPTLVVSPNTNNKFLGGAGIVAAHASSLGANVQFYSIVGDDENAKFAIEYLKKYALKPHLLTDKTRPTTLKQRFRVDDKTLLRVNYLRQYEISKKLQDEMWEELGPILKGQDLVIFSDFNYGCLPQALVDSISNYCHENGIKMAADSQSSSQLGDISRFKGVDMITPTEWEARVATKDYNSGLVNLAEVLAERTKTENVLLTLGKEGMLIHTSCSINRWVTDQLQSMNLAPKDVAGAGDSTLICASMGLAAGYDIWQCAYLGSIAAACQIGSLGNTPLSPETLRKELLK